MKKERDIDNLIVEKFKQRVDSLPDQEYEQGAWERFKVANATHIRRERLLRTRLYSYSAIGAAAVLFLGLFLFNYPLVSSISPIENRLSVIEAPIISVNKPKLNTNSPRSIASNSTRFIKVSTLLTQQSESSKTKKVEPIKEQKANETFSKQQMNEILTDDRDSKTKVNQKKEIVTKVVSESDNKSSQKRLFHFGVNISPGFNSSPSNMGGTFNYSGGLSLDIKIAENLELSTGLQLEHHNVIAESKVQTRDMLPAHIDAVLTNLDIPINIKWSFFSDNTRSYYVSGGLSSLAYLNEKYTTTSYDQQIQASTVALAADETITSYKIENIETVETTTVSPSNAFDFAGRVNIILGYEQRLTSKLNLHIEPFLKIPLSGLATENMRFTTGGVTFKVSF